LFSEVSNIFGRPFLVGSFLPAALFLAINYFAFMSIGPSVPFLVFLSDDPSLTPLRNQPSLVLLSISLASAIGMGLFLQLFNTQIVRAFEGYFFKSALGKLQQREQERFNKESVESEQLGNDIRELGRVIRSINEEISILKERISYLKEAERPCSAEEEQYHRWRQQNKTNRDVYTMKTRRRDEVLRYLAMRFPEDKELILPTRLGNTIRAFERYPSRVYGVESVTAWTRLLSVIPKQYIELVDNSKADVDFFVNTALLLIITVLEMIAMFFLYSWVTLIFAIFLLLGSAICYQLAVTKSKAWGSVVKSCFDNFRLDLLKQLGYKRPANLYRERQIWDVVSKTFLYMEYHDLEYEGQTASPSRSSLSGK